MQNDLLSMAGGEPAAETADRRACLAAITATVRALQEQGKPASAIIAALAIATVEVVDPARVPLN